MLRKLFLFYLCTFALSSFAQRLILKGTSPTQNEELSSLQTVTLYFDMSAVYEYYSSNKASDWKLAAIWYDDESAAKVYEGTDLSSTPIAEYKVGQSTKTEAGATEYTFSFDSPISLEAGKTYTLWMSRYVQGYCKNRAKTNTQLAEDITVTLIGTGEKKLSLASYSPLNTESLDSIDTLSLNFGVPVEVANGSSATIYDEDDSYATSVKMEVDANSSSMVNVVFGKTPLYKSHKYDIVIPASSIVSAEDENLTNAEIRLSDYQGTSVKYECNLISASPADSSEIKYLRSVDLKLNIPQGYSISAQKSSITLYKDGEEAPIGSYALSVSGTNSVSAVINNFNLDANSTYKVVLRQGSIAPRLSSTEYLYDTSNPEITVTYTTPANLEAVPRTEGLTVSATADSKISVLMPPFTFDGTTTFVRPNSGNSSVEDIEDKVEEKTRTFVTVPIYEVVDGEDVDKGTVKLEYNPAPDGAGDNVTGLEGTPDFSLYEGHTYKIVIPEGALFPYTLEGEYKNSLFWNLETPLSFAGATPTGITTAEGTGHGIKVEDGKITVSGLASGETVKVYTVAGTLIARQAADLSTIKIAVPAGTYIVMVGQKAFKTIVK